MDPSQQLVAGMTLAGLGLYFIYEMTPHTEATECLQSKPLPQDAMVPRVPPLVDLYQTSKPKVGEAYWWNHRTVVAPLPQDYVAHPPASYARPFPTQQAGIHDIFSLT